MAKVTKKFVKFSVQLELNQDELSALNAVLQSTGGCPSLSPRRYIDNILESLREAGVNDLLKSFHTNGSVMFDDFHPE